MGPYIGVTGFTTRNQTERALRAFPSQFAVLFAAGILVSRKTLRGMQNQWPHRYPSIESASTIFPQHGRVFRVVHYHTSDRTTLLGQLLHIMQYIPNVDAIQLNMAWPDNVPLSSFKKRHEGVEIIVQLGREALDSVDRSPVAVWKRFRRTYGALVDYALIDLSEGAGITLDPEELAPYVREFKDYDLPYGLGIAGGLCGSTVDRVSPLLDIWPFLSIDAESALRNHSTNELDLTRTETYIRNASHLFMQAHS